MCCCIFAYMTPTREEKVISAEPSIVFAPNLEDSPTFGNVYKNFMSHRGRKRLTSWTCKKTAIPGDLYFFYFGQSEAKIAGLAVCSEPPDPKGWKKRGRSNRQKMFFCSFDRLRHFHFPITVDELRENRTVDAWWQTRPYRGRPKTMPREVAATLLKIVAKREPTTSSLLTEYIRQCRSSGTRRKQSPQLNALEGTFYERLSWQAARSKALREAKIREALRKNTGHLVCEVTGCEFDFLDTYGELGRNFAHVHHRRSLAKRKASRTTLSDLAIVCANCHAMLHRRGECRSLQSIKATKTPKR
jgi:hypothetical protein